MRHIYKFIILIVLSNVTNMSDPVPSGSTSGEICSSES